MTLKMRFSIKRRLTLLMMAVSAVAALLTAIGFEVNHYATLQKSKASQMTSLAEVLALQSTTAMSFYRTAAVEELLRSMESRPTVERVCLFDKDGKLFACYLRDENATPTEKAPDLSGHRFEDDGSLSVVLPVAEDQEVLGTIYLRATTEDISSQFYRDAGVALLVIAVVMIAAVPISIGLQRVISRPIIKLTGAAQQVAQQGDYSIRVVPRSSDEIGTLYEHFNRMLEQIESADGALRRERDHSAGIIAGSPSIVCGIRPDGTTTFINPTGEQITGYSAEELVGRNWWKTFYPGEQYKQIEEIEQRNLDLSTVRDFEMTLTTKGGERRVISWNGMQRRDKDGNPLELIGFGTDVTERKRAQDEREKLIVELEAKNAELERFAYTVSHDLKTPLITIKGYIGLLEQDLADGNSEAVKEDLQPIADAADRMNQLLAQVLELSRIGRVTRPAEEVSFAELVREVTGMLERTIADKHIELDVAADLPVLYGDRSRLLEVVQNLIENAVKYIGTQPKPRIEIDGWQEGNEVVCYVADNGIGIDPRYHDKVFALFDQLDPSSEGVGVGLSLVKRIVEVHGGRIWVESAGEGAGSTFYFALPIGSAKQDPESVSEASEGR